MMHFIFDLIKWTIAVVGVILMVLFLCMILLFIGAARISKAQGEDYQSINGHPNDRRDK